mgnify:CR=1 FL=1
MNILNNASIKEIIDQEIELQSESVRGSPKRLDELLHDDFLEIGSLGSKYSKGDILERLPESEFSEMRPSNFEGRLMKDGLLLLSYDLEFTAVGEVVRSKRTSIWRKETSRWEMLFHQSTLKSPG